MSEAFRQVVRTHGLTISQIVSRSGVSRGTVEKVDKSIAIRYAYATRIVNAINDLAGTAHTVESLNIATVDN